MYAADLWLLRGTKVCSNNILDEYVNQYYPPHEDANLGNCKHIWDYIYKVVCGHVKMDKYNWDIKSLENVFLDRILNAT
jgi:hypothetical protein